MPKTNNTKQAAWVAIGSLFSFGFGIVSSMILSRYFNKADYGTYKQVIYVYGMMLTVFTLGLPKAYSYFLPRVERDQAKSLIKKLTYLFIALGATFSVVLFLCAGLFADLLKNPALRDALHLFAIVPLLTLPPMGLEGILSTYRKTQFMAVYTIISRTFMLCCVALPVMIWDLGYMQAILGFVVASAANCIIALILKYYPIRDAANEPCSITLKEIFSFSLPLLLANLWGMVILNCDQFFISRYFGKEVFAEFSNGFMDLPFVGMIVGACSTVLSPLYSRMSHEKVDLKKELYPLWISVFSKTVKLIYPLVLYCVVFADVVMVTLYGEQYEISSIFFRIKLLADFFTIITYGPLLINTGKVKFYQAVMMCSALILVPLEYVTILVFHNPIAVACVSIMCKIGRILVMLNCVAHIFGIPMYRVFPFQLIGRILIPSLLILLIIKYVIYSVEVIHNNSPIILLISFLLYCILFFAYTYIFKIDYIGMVTPLFSRTSSKLNN